MALKAGLPSPVLATWSLERVSAGVATGSASDVHKVLRGRQLALPVITEFGGVPTNP